jgi:hypothetical protein
MGKTVNNPLLTGVSGRIGDLLIKQYKSGTVITMMPSHNKNRKPTDRQKHQREVFSAAVKYAKGLRLQHIKQNGAAGRKDGQDIYHAGIRQFMAAVRRITENEVNFERSWAGLTKKAFTAEVIRFAHTIISGEYDQKQAVLEKAKTKAAAKKKVAVKKVAVKKPVKKKVIRKK